MYNLFLLKVTVPPSHNCPTLRRDPDANCGKTCAFRAQLGRPGIFMVAVCVERMVALFGSRTWIPWGFGRAFSTGNAQWIRSECWRKWFDAPVSTIRLVWGLVLPNL